MYYNNKAENKKTALLCKVVIKCDRQTIDAIKYKRPI